MQAIDTNVLVRLLVRDDQDQSTKVYRLLKTAEQKQKQVFVSHLVVLETAWVLKSNYHKSRDDIILALDSLIKLPVLFFENKETIESLIDTAKRSNFDLADIFIVEIARHHACKCVWTFDKKASKHGFFQLLS